MINLNIENAKQKYFANKQHYLSFRKAWADTVNNKIQISSTHVFLFCLLTEKNVLKAFTPATNRNKLMNGYAPYHNLDQAFGWVKHYARIAKEYFECLKRAEANTPFSFTLTTDKGKSPRERWLVNAETYKKQLEAFLSPFGGTVTIQMLADLGEQDIFKKMHLFPHTSTFKIQRISFTRKITYQEMWDVYMEG